MPFLQEAYCSDVYKRQPLDRNSKTADDPVEGASQHREQAFAVGHGGQALDASGIQHLADVYKRQP